MADLGKFTFTPRGMFCGACMAHWNPAGRDLATLLSEANRHEWVAHRTDAAPGLGAVS